LVNNKTNFVVDEIHIKENNYLSILLKYTNYKKLFIKYDKDFNDTAIKSHCERNNIEFGYTE
jgi:hypothetical protein